MSIARHGGRQARHIRRRRGFSDHGVIDVHPMAVDAHRVDVPHTDHDGVILDHAQQVDRGRITRHRCDMPGRITHQRPAHLCHGARAHHMSPARHHPADHHPRQDRPVRQAQQVSRSALGHIDHRSHCGPGGRKTRVWRRVRRCRIGQVPDRGLIFLKHQTHSAVQRERPVRDTEQLASPGIFGTENLNPIARPQWPGAHLGRVLHHHAKPPLLDPDARQIASPRLVVGIGQLDITPQLLTIGSHEHRVDVRIHIHRAAVARRNV